MGFPTHPCVCGCENAWGMNTPPDVVGKNAVKLVHDACRCSGMHGLNFDGGLRHPCFVPVNISRSVHLSAHSTRHPRGGVGGPSVRYTNVGDEKVGGLHDWVG